MTDTTNALSDDEVIEATRTFLKGVSYGAVHPHLDTLLDEVDPRSVALYALDQLMGTIADFHSKAEALAEVIGWDRRVDTGEMTDAIKVVDQAAAERGYWTWMTDEEWRVDPSDGITPL